MSFKKKKLKANATVRPSRPSDDVCELLVENGSDYQEAIRCFERKVGKNRSSKDLLGLKTQNSRGGAVIFFIRYDDLYLVGFQIDGKSYEFGHTGDKQLIAYSTFLGYRGSYRDMDEDSLVKIKMGYHALKDAIENLLKGKIRNDQGNWMREIKKYLATAIVMFPESARFRWLFVTLVRLMVSGEDCCVKPWMPKMIRSWADMSKIALGREEDGTQPPVDEDYQYTADDVDKALKFCNWAEDALVVHCLIKVPKETLHREKIEGIWRVLVKLADSAGNEENIYEKWSSVKKKFPDYNDGYNYNETL